MRALVCAGGNFSVGITTVYYVIAGYATGSATETKAQTTMRTAGIFSGLSVYVRTNPNTTPGTVTFRKAAANGNQTISIGAGITGSFADNVNTDSISAGDKINYLVVGGTTGTLVIGQIVLIFEATTDTDTRFMAGDTLNLFTASQTSYAVVGGDWNYQGTEVNTQFKLKTAGTMKALQCNVDTNARTATTIRLRKNATNTTQTISITASTAGVFEDTTHTDAVISGDLINYSIVTGTGTANEQLFGISVEMSTTTKLSHVVNGVGTGVTLTTGSTHYKALSDGLFTNSTESNLYTPSPEPFVASNIGIRVITNAATGAGTTKFRINAVDGNSSASITATTTGYFEDTTNKDSFTINDNVNYKVTSGTGGNTVITILGILLDGSDFRPNKINVVKQSINRATTF